MNYTFRDVKQKLCIIVADKAYGGILHDFIVAVNPNANSILCYAYVYPNTGLSFSVLSLAVYVDGDYSVLSGTENVDITVQAENMGDCPVIPIVNKALENMFFDKIIPINHMYYTENPSSNTRKFTCLDPFRHETFPDDVRAALFAGDKVEGIWVRLSKHIGVIEGADIFEGELLNELFATGSGLAKGDVAIVAVKTMDERPLCVVAPKP